MPSIEQISTWTIQEIVQEIGRILPAGQALVEAVTDGWHVATIERSEDATVLWTDRNADRKLVLLNAFGWLWLHNQKPKHPAWKPREGNRPARPHPTRGPRVADPADLDPDEIRSVYEKERKKD